MIRWNFEAEVPTGNSLCEGEAKLDELRWPGRPSPIAQSITHQGVFTGYILYCTYTQHQQYRMLYDFRLCCVYFIVSVSDLSPLYRYRRFTLLRKVSSPTPQSERWPKERKNAVRAAP